MGNRIGPMGLPSNTPMVVWSGTPTGDGTEQMGRPLKTHMVAKSGILMGNGTELTARPLNTPIGRKEWWVNGEAHRTDGPAIEWPNGGKEWWVNGEAHRTDGPAIEGADGYKGWCVHGEEISPAYSHVLTAAFASGLPIPKEVFPDMFKAMSGPREAGEEARRLNTILHKYWPLQVKKILATLFSDSDPAIKHLAFSLLGREAIPERAQGR